MTDRSTPRFEIRRRGVLASAGLLAGVGALPTVGGEEPDGGEEYALVQGDRCVPVIPLSGSDPVAAFYDYRLPEPYTNDAGAMRAESGPYYVSVGTRDLQRANESVLFLYDGPEGLSLVVVHGSIDGASGGGAATFRIEGLPADGRWVVKDDHYRDATTGEIPDSNYDRWSVDGGVHAIDWTWGAGGTDGGAFRDIRSASAVTIAPAFDDAATLYGEYYEGTVDGWSLLTADGDDLRRVALDMTTPVTIRRGGCPSSDATGPSGGSTDDDATDTADDDAEGGERTDETDTTGDEATDGADDEETSGGDDEETDRTKHEKKRTKHRKKRAKHEKKAERKRAKHEKQQRKHRKAQRKHRKKAEKEREKHEKERRKHRKEPERKRAKHGK